MIGGYEGEGSSVRPDKHQGISWADLDPIKRKNGPSGGESRTGKRLSQTPLKIAKRSAQRIPLIYVAKKQDKRVFVFLNLACNQSRLV